MRVAGLAGVLAVAAGLVLLETVSRDTALISLGSGVILIFLAICYEIFSAHASVLSARGRMGSSAFLQVLLVLVLVVGVNVFAFFHHRRFDLTRNSEFSELRQNPTFRQDLARLTGDTRIVVFRGGRPFGQLAEKQDNYGAAAARKIVAKVRDNAEQFQDLGPRFRVEVLDIQEDDYQDKLRTLKEEAPKLAEAIEQAPEDSIFFYADGSVQRLAFHDVYQLDRKASQEANTGRGNLVLHYQGVEPFARKVLNVEEKRPRIGVGVIHEVLGQENADEVNKELGMAGVKKALTTRGFDTRDIILKKWGDGPPEPAVLTYGENRYERLEGEIAELDESIKARTEAIKELQDEKKLWTEGTEEEANARVNKRYVIVLLRDRDVLADREDVEAEKKKGRKIATAPINTEVRDFHVKNNIEPPLALHQLSLQREQTERDALAKEQKGLNVEDLAEQRRITDLRAKFNRMLADCDMLIVPRMTLFNVARSDRIPNSIYKLDEGQINAIRDFMRAGKPVLFCLGPTNDPPGRPDPFDAGSDRLEGMLTELGFRLPKQTVLYNVETKSFGERRGALLIMGSAKVEVPPVEFAWKAGGRPGLIKESGKGNTIRTSIELAARSVGQGQGLDLRLRHPRPVYLAEAGGDKIGGEKANDEAVFMMTSPDAWNESEPYPTRERTPRFEPPKKGDRDEGKLTEKRQGQFPIGVAAEVKVPASWGEGSSTTSDQKVRVAVIGHGGVFMGPTLNPVQEQLLLDVSNWLLGRDDLLARGDRIWQYPRVEMNEQVLALWQWAAGLGLPVSFVFLGCVVLLVRRIR
jgi:hypothetical protein